MATDRVISNQERILGNQESIEKNQAKLRLASREELEA